MTCIKSDLVANGNIVSESQFSLEADRSRDRRAVTNPPIASNDLERLAQLMIANEVLMDELVASRARIVAARNYLDRPDGNNRFGLAHLERCRAKHSGILSQLRANRIEALQLLG